MGQEIYSKLLVEYKNRNNLTNSQIASMTGIDTSTISRILKGTSKNLQQESKMKIAQLLNMTFNEIEDLVTKNNKPILGYVRAGYDLFIDENLQGYMQVSDDEVNKGDYFLRVTGDSMIQAKIFNNDLLYVRSTHQVRSGEIAVVMIDQEVTVKRVIYKGDLLILEAANPNYENKFFTREEVINLPVKIIGKVIYSRTEFE